VREVRVSAHAVEADSVTFQYGESIAIDRSSFAIDAGTITALIGPNGSGKSTILSGIAGLLSPSTGSLVVHPVSGRTRRIAYVLQTTKVNDALPITVREVIAMGRYAGKGAYGWLREPDRTAIDEAMARMEITPLGERHLRELSGGQRQRVFVAQGLAQDHDVLLLDEPLTGLDLTSARAIDDVIHDEHARGCTVIMTTHDLAEARVADRVILLAGRVVASGTPDEVLTLEHLTAAYGPSLLHLEGERLFLDDPAHSPVPGRHIHRDRSISVQPPATDGD
jgi:iron complex transport system ATP-binding protein